MISPSNVQRLLIDLNECHRSQDLVFEKESLASVHEIDFPNSLPVNKSSLDAHNTSSINSLASSRSELSPLPEVIQRSNQKPNSRSRVIHRRPDIGKLVTMNIRKAGQRLEENGIPNGRVLVVVCGPRKMVGDVRGGVASWTAKGDGVGVELLVEEFGW